ncbi:hypothetical protein [Microbacterium sp.]|uniref:hypothetical protein n=1 Tax=Microbacterium sp. TaxID=51671 RepID=UPI003C722B36
MLHFVNRVDASNAGDRVASPLTHFADFFTRYRVRRHDIRFIDFDEIHAGDVVIVGGGGLFDYAEFTNRAVNALFETGATVISWSPGFNTHDAFHESFTTPIAFERFTLATVRDFGNDRGVPYLPDVSCALPQLRERRETRREFGIARHKDHPIGLSGIDTITNASSLDDILTFLSETEVVVANSYHLIYWATLLGRKCISPTGFSSRFAHFAYPPTFFDPHTDDLSAVAAEARVYDVLDECVTQTGAFFSQVQEIVERRLSPASPTRQIYGLATELSIEQQRARESRLSLGNIVVSQLLVDTGDGFDPHQALSAVNNVYGDESMSARFDLSGFAGVERIRFRPLDGWPCKVTIVSATTDLDPIPLN